MAVGEARGVPGWSEPHSDRYGTSEARCGARRSQAAPIQPENPPRTGFRNAPSRTSSNSVTTRFSGGFMNNAG
jgi:hypothetical protein